MLYGRTGSNGRVLAVHDKVTAICRAREMHACLCVGPWSEEAELCAFGSIILAHLFSRASAGQMMVRNGDDRGLAAPVRCAAALN